MTNKERREIKKLVRMMREAGVRYRASKPVIEMLETAADEIERLQSIVQSDAEPVAWRWRWKHDPPNEWNFAVNEFHGEHIIIEPLYTARPQSGSGSKL